MEPTPGAVARPRDAHPEDRRVITAAFVDLSGSTALAERLDPEELRALMSAYLETVSDEIRRFGGSIEKYIGDAVVAVWGAPVAREDDARQALEAALAVRSAMRALNERLQAESRPQLEVRIGVNSGRVVAGDLPGVGERTYLISGDAMNTAQRLEAAAAPGEILVGALTHHLTDDAFTFGAPRRVVAKGKRLPFEAFPLIADLPAGLARPVVSPLVGRDAELDSLDIAFAALRSGSGGMSLIVGDAGLGKSRLLSEAKRRETGVKWLEGRALRMRRETSYSPFREALLAEIRLDARASEREVWDAALSRAEQLLGENQTDTGVYIAALLGVTQPPPESGITYPEAEELGRQIRRAAKAYFVALAREQPTVVALEDWHWADGASSELLAHLLPVAAREPLLFVVVGRPDDESPIAPLLRRAGTRRLELERLTEGATRDLIDNLLDGEVPSAVVRPIAAATEGNPYFIEEVVRSLVEAGTLRRDGGSWRIGNESAAIRIPERLEAVIAERLDRLSDVPKAIVRAASVIGREFRSEVVEHVTGLGEELPGVLGSLTRLGLIERPAQGDSSYRFRHVLIQETAYEGILAQRRRELHGRVAAYLEEHPGAGGDEPALAYHYTQAANWPKALEFLAKAGDRAASVAADTEALSHYRRALDAYEQAFAEGWDPSQRAALLRKMAEALLRRGEHTAAVEQCYAALTALGVDYPWTRWGVRLALLRELTVQVGHRIWPRSASASSLSSDLDSMRVLEAMAWSDYYLGDNERLFLTCVMALNESERRGDDRAIAVSCFAVGIAAFCMRRPDIAIWYFRHGAQRAQRIGDPFVLGYAALGPAGHDHYARGALREAAAGYEVARDHFARARETRRWGVPTLQLGWIRLAYDLPGAETLSRELATAGEGGADPQLTAWALLLQGRLALRRGDYPEAERQLRDAAEKAKRVPDYATLVSAWGDLSIAMLERGRADEALHLAREATSLVRARDLRTPFATGAFHALARTSLAAAEGAPDKRRKAALREADAALRRCRWQSKLDRPSLPHTLRLTAALHAARGDDRNATKAWTRSVALAREHRDLYEEAQTHLAIARHTGDAAASAVARAAAQALLSQLGITAAGA